MSPTHANKKGVRYRYYTSRALLQGRREDAGSVARFSAEDVERLVLEALRSGNDADAGVSHRDLIDRRLDRAIIRQDSLEVATQTPRSDGEPSAPPITQSIPFTPPSLPKKGVAHRTGASPGPTEAERSTTLTAISRSKAWVEEILRNPSETFETIATREGRSARYIKLLAPLACVTPRLIEALAEGRPVVDMTVTSLSKSLPLSWADQERAFLPN